ncbi:minor capsid protein [Metabacillus sp. HB246100]
MINLDVKININSNMLKQKNERALKEAQFILDEQILKDSNYYIPKQEGYLEKSGVLHSRMGQGHIEWRRPQARRLYYNPQYNFSKDANPNARGLWYEAAKALRKMDWVRIAKIPYQKYFKGK